MQRKSILQGFIIVVAIVGLATWASAQSPGILTAMMGGGMSGGMGGGMGGGMMGNGSGYGYGMGNQQGDYRRQPQRDYGRQPQNYGSTQLSPEDAARLRDARERFDQDTRDLRFAIRDKQVALNEELRRTPPDKAKASQLQQELSRLKAEYDQKALAFDIETRQIAPDAARARDLPSGNPYGRW